MKVKCLDTVNGVSKSGKSYTRGAFRSFGKSGNPFLFLAFCPAEYKAGQEYSVNVCFSPSGNYILPY